jgi:antitoxin CcdA
MRSKVNRRPANLSLDEGIVSDARSLNINLSRAAEDGIAIAVKAERERLWRLENADAIAGMNDYIDKKGLPLDKHRQF